MSASALCTAAVILLGAINVWEVDAIALGLGCVIAVDNPVRQAFLDDMVGAKLLHNAIALQSSISSSGSAWTYDRRRTADRRRPGWCFLINGLS